MAQFKNRTDFYEIWYLEVFTMIYQGIPILLKMNKTNGHFTLWPSCTLVQKWLHGESPCWKYPMMSPLIQTGIKQPAHKKNTDPRQLWHHWCRLQVSNYGKHTRTVMLCIFLTCSNERRVLQKKAPFIPSVRADENAPWKKYACETFTKVGKTGTNK
jgi:hypothetical protein